MIVELGKIKSKLLFESLCFSGFNHLSPKLKSLTHRVPNRSFYNVLSPCVLVVLTT
ncbi:hypothetical protein Hanom_Chr07g00671271 [Helianthus anomalus]